MTLVLDQSSQVTVQKQYSNVLVFGDFSVAGIKYTATKDCICFINSMLAVGVGASVQVGSAGNVIVIDASTPVGSIFTRFLKAGDTIACAGPAIGPGRVSVSVGEY